MATFEFDIVNGKTREIPGKNTVEIPRSFPGENIPENPFDFMDEKSEENLGSFLGFSLVVFTVILFFFFGRITAFCIAVFLTVLAWRVRQIQLLNKKRKFVAKLKSPVFITSRYGHDVSVYKRKVIAEGLIRSAWPDNRYMPTPPVYAMYKGDEGEMEWEWQERKDRFKVEKTKEYHSEIKQRNEGYYYRFILEQAEYPWEEKEQRD